MTKFVKNGLFIFLVFFIFLILPNHTALSAANEKFSITNESITQKVVNFFSGVLNSVVDFWKKYIGEPASRVWDKLKLFFINGVLNKAPEVKKEMIKEVGEMKEDVPKQTETLFQKIGNFFKR